MEEVAQIPEEELFHTVIGGAGKMFLLIGLVCMAVSTAYFYACAMKKEGDAQFFEGLTMMITGIATLAYLCMFSDGGFVIHEGRQFFYARYIDWILTTPLMVWDILALGNVNGSEIMFTVGIDMLMIGFGVVGAQLHGGIKWVFWALGCLCYMHVVGVLMRYMNNATSMAAKKLYGQVAWLTIVLWTFYPVAWVVAEGVRAVSCTTEAAIYMVLDVLSKCMFGFVIVSSRNALESVVSEKAGYNSVA
jgi:bacteriorhodopsin